MEILKENPRMDSFHIYIHTRYIMRSYLTSFLNRVYSEFNDVFSCNSSDSLSREEFAKDSSKNRLPSNPPTQSDQGSGNQEKVNSGKKGSGNKGSGKKGKVNKGCESGSNDGSSDSNNQGLIPPGGGGGPNGGDNSGAGGVPAKGLNRFHILNNLRENLVYCISMLNTQIKYDRYRHKFLITHRNHPQDYVMPVDVQEATPRLTLLTGIGWPHLPRI